MTSNSSGPSMHFGFDRLLARIAAALDDAQLPYMVIGGQAVVVHGEPRLTRDVDVTVAISPAESHRLIDLLPALGLMPLVDDPQTFISDTHILPCAVESQPLRVDFSLTDAPYEVQAIPRGKDRTIHGVNVRFASVEDLLVHKLVASRPRDLEDARSVILKNPGFDHDYVRHWLTRYAEVLEKPFVDAFDALVDECRS